ncbi:MAG: hypothetical protein AAF842_11050 [Planctomycetota bacterium]
MAKLIDTSLRDGHQSLLATRMSTEQCMRVLPMVADAGYDIIELWGGATLDAALRFTNDNPFDRLERFIALLDQHDRPIHIRSLCRGQNLFGYAPYPDNVVTAFLKEAVRTATTSNVTHRMRIFDALNDHRNLITATMATKTFDGHAEAAMSYTTSPVHDNDHFIGFAEQAIDWGADSLAIKDMAGLLHPADAWSLIEAVKSRFPEKFLTLHAHDTNGLAIASYVVGLMAGVDALDTAYGPMAGATSQPPAELIKFFGDRLGIDLGIDFSNANKIDAELRTIRQELAAVDKNPDQFGGPWPSEPTDDMKAAIDEAIELLKTKDRDKCTLACDVIEQKIMEPMGYPAIDKSQLESQIPGGMLSNLYNQLKDQDKLDLMPQVQDEIPKVRKAAGYVPLVTPTSQIVGTQATFNVMQGAPYAFVSEPFRDMMMGKYGRLPGPADPEVMEKVARGEEPFTGRPADRVQDVDLNALYREHGDLIKSERDLLLLVLFPAPAEKFLKERTKTN